MRRNPTPILVLAAASLAVPAAAHDIWLQADAYRLDPGATLTVRQLVGEELAADHSHDGEGHEGTQELPVLRDMTPRFALVTASGTVDLLAELPDFRERPEVLPVLERELDARGLVLVAMDHSTLYTDHTNEEFLAYLEHEDLTGAGLEERMAATDYQSEGYVRSLKTLVKVGDGAADGAVASRPLGQEIEIVLLDDPYSLDAGDTLRARVLLHGEPLAGQVVKAYVSDGHRIDRQRATTDGEGVARFTLSGRGLWLVRLVHLAPCSVRSPVECADATFESYWSAFTFELD